MMDRDTLDQILSVPETCCGGLHEDDFDGFATTEDPQFEAVVGSGQVVNHTLNLTYTW